ncbi:hypothetical protein M9458_036839, partial [Cirrhinus mrigala]
CDEVCLMEGFCYRLDDDIRFVMPHGDPCWTIKSYINFALWMKGSAFMDYISVQPQRADFSQCDPEPSQPSSPLSTDCKPEPTADMEPEQIAFQEPEKETELDNATEPKPNLRYIDRARGNL